MLCFVTLTNSLLSVVLWICKTTPRFGSLLGLTALCVCSYVHGCGLLIVEEYTVKAANEKIAWTKSEGNQEQASKSPLPRTCLIPAVSKCENRGEVLSTRKVH